MNRSRAWILLLLLLPGMVGRVEGQIEAGGRVFERSPVERGAKGEWVFYERGAPRDEGTRRWLTRRVLVEWEPGRRRKVAGEVPGAVRVTERGRYAVVEFGGAEDSALAGARRLRQLPEVRAAEPMLARQWQRKLEPDDPLFSHQPGAAGYQWHLENTGQNGGTAGVDLNVTGVWDRYQGDGVRIGIVDDGLEQGHADLEANVDRVIGYDFNDLDDDPAPGEGDSHGTACAGVAAARGNNGRGVTGTAPRARLVGMRLIAAPTTDAEQADAFLHEKVRIEIKSNSWGPYDNARGTGGPGPLSLAAMEEAVRTGRGGLGTIFLWAAGNGAGAGDDSNYDGWANWPHAIAVSAINDRGRAAWYSEPGANILVCAPSSGRQGITTTDRSGAEGYNTEGGTYEDPDHADTDYTNGFGGTSSATPAVAGVVALMLEANPQLTYRDVQEILVRTAEQNDFYSGEWVTNGGGFHFHPVYGAGLVDAEAATEMAAGWAGVAPLVRREVRDTRPAEAIPDADEAGLSRSFVVPAADNLRLEHVTVKVKATHPYAGNLEWRLTSPSGVTARLARARFNDTTRDLDWTFMATTFWGERSEGEWKLEVFDRMVDHEGTLDEVAITFHGTAAPAELPLPRITSSWIIVGREGGEVRHRITAANGATHFDAGSAVFGGLPPGLVIDPATGEITGQPLVTGLYEGYQSATNATGTYSEAVYFYFLAADARLAEAVEQPEVMKMVPFGFGDPFRQTETTRDGEDAIETAGVDDDEYSGVEFTVEGPARLAFQWKVSSEKNYDYLVLTVDGRLRGYITGETDWTGVTTDIGEGKRTVNIYYWKDQAESGGLDRGWIDEMEITPITTRPEIVTRTVRVYEGVPFRRQVEATNAPESYEASGLPSGIRLHGPTGLLYGVSGAEGSQDVELRATNLFGTGGGMVTIETGTVAEGLAEALDAPGQEVAGAGAKSWVPQEVYAWDGEDAARSGEIGDLEETEMRTTMTGPCKASFYWGVSSEEGYDEMRFYVDGEEQEAISGETGWVRKEVLLSEGSHELKWTYRKDEFTASGLDAGLVDRLERHVDADGDGLHADVEAWFGTSDEDAQSRVEVEVTREAEGMSVRFPSVAGNSYRIEHSEDLVKWQAVVVEATAAETTWTDRNLGGRKQRFYRVVIP